MNGFIVIDKPAGITSHDVVSRVRRIAGTRRVGHTGTLDPFATGVLPVAVNEGTKAIPFLDEGIKVYEGVMRLGVATDTLDMTGRVIREADCSKVSRELFEGVISHFMGIITQLPPMFSAIKRDGQPLYKLARQGLSVEREPRRVQIHALEICAFNLPFVSLRITCSRGTYIRSLADDIGSALGCGAALLDLRRTGSGPFNINAAVSLEVLEETVKAGDVDTICISPYAALEHLTDIPLTDTGVVKVRNGRSPEAGDTVSDDVSGGGGTFTNLVRLSQGSGLVAVAEHRREHHSMFRIKRVFC